jgi:hypothetical protein
MAAPKSKRTRSRNFGPDASIEDDVSFAICFLAAVNLGGSIVAGMCCALPPTPHRATKLIQRRTAHSASMNLQPATFYGILATLSAALPARADQLAVKETVLGAMIIGFVGLANRWFMDAGNAEQLVRFDVGPGRLKKHTSDSLACAVDPATPTAAVAARANGRRR